MLVDFLMRTRKQFLYFEISRVDVECYFLTMFMFHWVI